MTYRNFHLLVTIDGLTKAFDMVKPPTSTARACRYRRSIRWRSTPCSVSSVLIGGEDEHLLWDTKRMESPSKALGLSPLQI